jgi:hypothetical protein
LTFQQKSRLTISNVLNYPSVMAPSSQLKTIDEVIDAFGGVKAMCSIFGGGPSRFSNYKAAGRFPDSMHMRIYVEARDRGLNIAPALIGMERPKLQGTLKLHAERGCSV